MRARLGMQAVPVAAEDAELIRWLGEEVATQLVEELPEDQREAVRAHVLEDRGYAEIAADERLTGGDRAQARQPRPARPARPSRREPMSSDYILACAASCCGRPRPSPAPSRADRGRLRHAHAAAAAARRRGDAGWPCGPAQRGERRPAGGAAAGHRAAGAIDAAAAAAAGRPRRGRAGHRRRRLHRCRATARTTRRSRPPRPGGSDYRTTPAAADATVEDPPRAARPRRRSARDGRRPRAASQGRRPAGGDGRRHRADGAGPPRDLLLGGQRARARRQAGARRPGRSPAAPTPAARRRSRRPRPRRAPSRSMPTRASCRPRAATGTSRSRVPPAITNAALAGARVAMDVPTQRPDRRARLHRRRVSARSRTSRARSRRAGPTTPSAATRSMTSHHFAIVVDDRIVSVPFINWQENPDGIDGAQGAQIASRRPSQARRWPRS